MAKYLVTFNDVFNSVEIGGFSVMTDKEADSFEKLVESISWDFTYPLPIGELDFSSGEDLLSKIDFKEISNEEYKVLKKLFDDSYGVFISEEFLQDLLGEESEDLEDLDDSDEHLGDYDVSFDDN
jgi:hypothetical protein